AAYPQLEASLREGWDAEVEAEYARRRQLQQQQNRQAINRAKQKKLDPPTDLPDPSLIQPGPDDVYDYDAESAGFDAVATVILNLDAALNK
ncbi:MAG: hypothetical protein AAGA25_10535, partial [Planctomycetota bacterium]